MNLFFTKNIQDKTAIFEEEEARHLVVLRKKIGDEVHFTNGKGYFYSGKIIEINKRNVLLIIDNQRIEEKNHQRHLHIAIAPTKNMDRVEWFLEKATEIGIDEISFLACQNSEREKIRLDRLEKIVESAMKQSLQATLPKLNDLVSYTAFMKNINTQNADSQRFIAYCNTPDLIPYSAVSAEKRLILIGPEGDFSQKEVDAALANNFQGISLGKNRLRTETAALYCVAQFAG
jgi:16S rRNA (uracil1498-N3)-methyltransferase